jgi:hypothetical protein
VLRHYVAPDHFLTLGIPIVQGRVFTVADTAEAPRVTVVSETAARTFWPRGDAIGQRVWFGGGSNFDSLERSALHRRRRWRRRLSSRSTGGRILELLHAVHTVHVPMRAVFVRTMQDPMAALT